LTIEDGKPREALMLAPAEISADAGKHAGGRRSASEEGGMRLELAGVSVTEGTVTAVLGDERQGARWFRHGQHLHVWIRDAHHEFVIEDPRSREFTASASTGGLTTPLPGVVSAVPVQEGQAVAAGELLMVIEAMKMEHSITAPYDGVVRAIHFARGDRVPEGSELLALSPAGDSAS
jgi:3-methylcrotonyl-CoA carboxylase alpha subunit